jgi:hypothetical protein
LVSGVGFQVSGGRRALAREEQERKEQVRGYNPGATRFAYVLKGAMHTRRAVSGVRETVTR